MSMQTPSTQNDILYAKLRDMTLRAERGIWCCSHFLSPREARLACEYVRLCKADVYCALEGGYADAERVKLFLLPDFMSEPEYLAPLAEEKMCLLRIKGGGFCTLTHRDYLGSLLALGIERHVLGDLVVLDDHSALLFCDADIAPYICAELVRVGKDGVKIERLPWDTPVELPERYKSMSDTVASARFDCVAAALAGLSREKAQLLIRAGECTVDYEPCDKCDKVIDPPCVISLRGYGKFRIDDLGMQTKKGRLRLLARKYI